MAKQIKITLTATWTYTPSAEDLEVNLLEDITEEDKNIDPFEILHNSDSCEITTEIIDNPSETVEFPGPIRG